MRAASRAISSDSGEPCPGRGRVVALIVLALSLLGLAALPALHDAVYHAADERSALAAGYAHDGHACHHHAPQPDEPEPAQPDHDERSCDICHLIHKVRNAAAAHTLPAEAICIIADRRERVLLPEALRPTTFSLTDAPARGPPRCA